MSACGGSSSEPDASMDVTVGCPTGLTSCSGSCVDLQADPANCGGCKTMCGNGQVCGAGACLQTCGGGSAICGDACADLIGDPNNCGGCNVKCLSGQVCNDGGCALSCQPGFDKCANDAGQPTCIDPQANDYNCNGCGNVCGPGTRCEAGVCGITCQTGLSVCNIDIDASDGATSANVCVDLIVDPQNCGGCGNVCDAGTFCSPTDDAGDAACGLGCFGGSDLCSNRCIDPRIDPYNCGGCNIVCDGGQSCVSSKCQ
jgi:hypothetical protein